MARKIKPMDEVSSDGTGGETPRSHLPPPPPGGMPPYPPMGYPPSGMPAPPPTNKPKIAGILLIISALIIIGSSFIYFTMDDDDFSEMMETSLSSQPEDKVDVSGTVFDENNTPMAGVNLRVALIDKTINTTTDEDGTFTLKAVPTGKQIIVISKEDYRPINHRIFVETPEYRNNEDYDLTFEMEKGEGVVQSGEYKSEFSGLLGTIFLVCAVLMIVFAVLMIVSGVMVTKRRFRGLGLFACVIGIIFGLSAFYVGTALCIIALYLLIKSKHEFNKEIRRY